MNVVYITIFFTVIVQGLTIKSVYFGIEKHKAQRCRSRKADIIGLTEYAGRLKGFRPSVLHAEWISRLYG